MSEQKAPDEGSFIHTMLYLYWYKSIICGYVRFEPDRRSFSEPQPLTTALRKVVREELHADVHKSPRAVVFHSIEGVSDSVMAAAKH